jgi:hypothetical protein
MARQNPLNHQEPGVFLDAVLLFYVEPEATQENMATFSAMHVLRFYHRRLTMVTVLLLPSAILVVTAVLVLSTSVVPTPNTPSHAREQQR